MIRPHHELGRICIGTRSRPALTRAADRVYAGRPENHEPGPELSTGVRVVHRRAEATGSPGSPPERWTRDSHHANTAGPGLDSLGDATADTLRDARAGLPPTTLRLAPRPTAPGGPRLRATGDGVRRRPPRRRPGRPTGHPGPGRRRRRGRARGPGGRPHGRLVAARRRPANHLRTSGPRRPPRPTGTPRRAHRHPPPGPRGLPGGGLPPLGRGPPDPTPLPHLPGPAPPTGERQGPPPPEAGRQHPTGQPPHPAARPSDQPRGKRPTTDHLLPHPTRHPPALTSDHEQPASTMPRTPSRLSPLAPHAPRPSRPSPRGPDPWALARGQLTRSAHRTAPPTPHCHPPPSLTR